MAKAVRPKNDSKVDNGNKNVSAQPVREPSELVIKEIMIQKSVSREQAIHILKNPS